MSTNYKGASEDKTVLSTFPIYSAKLGTKAD
jgi:hypothetical protein